MEPYISQILKVLQNCVDTDSVLLVNQDGIIEYGWTAINYYGDPAGKHILDIYPQLDENTSTVLRALKSGRPVYGERQELINSCGERVLMESTDIPIVSNGRVQCVVDSTKFFIVDQRVFRDRREDGLPATDRILTQDPKMRALKRRIHDVSSLDAPVLIYGETGTGKELVAEALHSTGRRGNQPFISQNCAAIPTNLLESIFFGTEKGSYTGAVSRKGLFEEAEGGTLFLDELSAMDIGLQAKLLKVLEEKKIRRLGGSQDISFDVRIVAAVNEEPAQLVQEHRLREDLFYRLAVIRLSIPPLRERQGDIELLTQHFVERFSRAMRRNVSSVSPLVMEFFQHYRWPGNVRELKNTLEGAIAIAESKQLMLEDITGLMGMNMHGSRFSGPYLSKDILRNGFSLPRELERYERELLKAALEQSDSFTQAANLLGISSQNLNYKRQKYML